MNKYLKPTLFFTLSFFFILFSACDNEPIDGGIINDNGNNNNNPNTSTGDYWPRAINNSWTYNALSGNEETYTITGVEVIDGNEYFAFDNLLGMPSWLRKNGAYYYVRNEFTYEIPGYESNVTAFTVTMLKDDAEVGEIWTSNVNYTISFTPIGGSPAIPDISSSAIYSFEMMDRDITHIVEGITYENVLHLNLEVSSQGQISSAEYFYAKDIGLIEYNSQGGNVTLINYTLN